MGFKINSRNWKFQFTLNSKENEKLFSKFYNSSLLPIILVKRMKFHPLYHFISVSGAMTALRKKSYRGSFEISTWTDSGQSWYHAIVRHLRKIRRCCVHADQRKKRGNLKLAVWSRRDSLKKHEIIAVESSMNGWTYLGKRGMAQLWLMGRRSRQPAICSLAH